MNGWNGERAATVPIARFAMRAQTLSRGVYVACMLLSTVLAFAKVLIFALLLDPIGFGQYTFALLLLSVASYFAAAGLAEGLSREVPMLRGRGRTAEAVGARNASVMAALVVAGMVGATCAAGITLYARSHVDFLPLPWVGLTIAATIPCNLLLIDLAGRELSTEYSLMLILKSATSIFAGALGINLMGVGGALVGEAAGALLTAGAVIALYSRDILHGRGTLGREAWRISRIGLPFMFSSVVLTLTLSMDRWFVQSRFGMAVFGEYAFAFLFWTSGMSLYNMLSVYLRPRIVAKFARSGDVQQTLRYVRRLGLVIGWFFLALMVPALWTAFWVIDLRYPEYASAKPLLIPVYLGTMFWSANFYGALFVIRGDGRFPLILNLVNGVLCALALGFVAWVSAPLFWYALVFCVFRLLHLVTSVIVAKRVPLVSAA